MDISIARAVRAIQLSSARVRQAVRQDRLAYLHGLQQQLAERDLKDARALYQALRRAFPQARSSRRSGFQPLPQVQMPSGDFAATREQRLCCWGEFFADQEAGYPVTGSQYQAELAVQKSRVAARACPGGVFDWATMPSLAGTERLILAARVRKAAGYDGITMEMLKLSPPRSARYLFPLFAKITTCLYEPVAFRGGALMVLAKRAGAAFQCSDFRSILLACSSSKLYHKCLRGRLVGVLHKVRSSLQYGAIPGCGVEALSLLTKAFVDTATSSGRAWALVFYDIRAAFYRVVRQLVASVPDSDAGLQRVVSTLGLPAAAMLELRDKLETLAALPLASSNEHLAELVADVLQGTYFRLEYDHLLYVTKRGTRPGDPCADVLFGLLLSSYFKSVDSRLEQRGLGEPLPSLAAPPLSRLPMTVSHLGFISWADDCLRGTTAGSLSQVVARATEVLEVSIATASSLGIAFSYSSSKTCVMLPAHRSPVAQLAAPGVEIPSALTSLCLTDPLTQDAVCVEVVSVYKHLGSILAADRSTRPDVQYRYSQAMAVARPLAYRFFSCRRYPLCVRRCILRSLVVSKYLHGSVSLTLTTGVHFRKWCNNYVALWRLLCRREPGSRRLAHAFESLAIGGAVSPPLALALARAVFLQRHVLAGPVELLLFLQRHWELAGKASWLHQLNTHVTIVAGLVPGERVLQSSANTVRAVLDSMHDMPGWWVRCVKAAHRKYAEDLHDWVHREVSAPPLAPSFVDAPFECQYCRERFTLRRYLCSHLAKRHGVYSPARHYAPTRHCLACHRFYDSVQAVQNHLRKSDACLQRLVHLIPPLAAEEILCAERAYDGGRGQVARGQWQAFRKSGPIYLAYGPRIPMFSERFLSDDPEEDFIADLGRYFKPRVADLQWVDDYLRARSVIDSQPEARCFWTSRLSECPRPTSDFFRRQLFHLSARVLGNGSNEP